MLLHAISQVLSCHSLKWKLGGGGIHIGLNCSNSQSLCSDNPPVQPALTTSGPGGGCPAGYVSSVSPVSSQSSFHTNRSQKKLLPHFEL